jgi:biotin synthase
VLREISIDVQAYASEKDRDVLNLLNAFWRIDRPRGQSSGPTTADLQFCMEGRPSGVLAHNVEHGPGKLYTGLGPNHQASGVHMRDHIDGSASLRGTIDIIRRDWPRDEVGRLFDLAFPDLIFEAQRIHRMHFDPREVQISTLLSIKTGGCPEDCAYCPQSAHYEVNVSVGKLMTVDSVLEEARAAKTAGASRFCMGAAWRSPKDRDIDQICAMIEGVGSLGLETCATLGMLNERQAQRLADSGLEYYNHNLDTSPEFYGRIITTRTYQDRLETLEHVRNAGIGVCCGGIVGMGESREDRIGMITTLASLPVHPESVPINMLVRVQGTPLANQQPLDPLEYVRVIAVARITMPRSMVRLSAGRESMSDETQALCFLAGANSIFYGPKLLTTPNPAPDRDMRLLDVLGMVPMRS